MSVDVDALPALWVVVVDPLAADPAVVDVLPVAAELPLVAEALVVDDVDAELVAPVNALTRA